MQIDHFPDLVQTDLLLEKIRSGHCAWGTRPIDKPLYLFGAGNLGQMASEYFRVLGIAPQGAVDFALDRGASPRLWNGVPLSNPHDVESSVKKESLALYSFKNFFCSSVKFSKSTTFFSIYASYVLILFASLAKKSP